jgi:glycerol-3-phosphate dehydrogenase
MIRRTMVSWSADMGYAAAETAARAAAPTLGWSEEKIAEEVAVYRAHLAHFHKVRAAG